VVIVDGGIWTEVLDFINSTTASTHYVVEYDFTGQPTVIFGDGEFGLKPGTGSLITVGWRTCEGQIGNLPPGEMNFAQSFARVTSVTNEAPAKGELLSDTDVGASTVALVDDGSIDGFLDSGVAYIDEDSFTYTGKSGNTFTGCSGLENPHVAEEVVTYSTSYVYGANAETNKRAKVSAIRYNRMKTSALSVLDYQATAERVPGVARARTVSSYNVMTTQIIPVDAGIPTSTLLTSVYDYILPRKCGTHTISIINPKYVYIDVTAQVSPFGGNSFSHTVQPLVLSQIQSFLNPLTTDDDSLYYINGWGNLLKKNWLEATIFNLNDGALVSDVEVTLFKRSTDKEGSSNIQLAPNEIAHVGRISVVWKDIAAQVPIGEQEAYSGVKTLPKTAVEIQ